MSNLIRLVRLAFLCACAPFLLVTTITAQVSGVKTIPGDYPSIKQAIFQIYAQGGLGGPTVLELQPGYNSSVETFPIGFGPIPGAGPNSTLTISPAAGATGLAIISSNSGATFELEGTSYVTFDGRPGRTGSARELTIQNTAQDGRAFSFFDGSFNNTVNYCTLDGTTYASGIRQNHIVFFGKSGAPLPVNVLYSNSDNTISNCLIKGYTTTGILAQGADFVENANNHIINNEITNFAIRGIMALDHSRNWDISGNSIYAGPFTDELDETGILVQSASGNNVISGNFIGGQAAQAGGAPWINSHHHTVTSTTGINIYEVGNVLVENNTIQNIAISGSGFASFFHGIIVSNSTAQVNGNLIGATGVPGPTGSIDMLGDKLLDFKGIEVSGCAPISVTDNRINNISLRGNGSAVPANFVGISYSGSGNITVTGNQIAQLTANSSGNISFTAITSAGNTNCPNFPLRGEFDRNLVKNITLSSTSDDASFTGIDIIARIAGNTGNVIGSATEANSISVSGKIASATGVAIHGTADDVSVSGDVIANLTAAGTLSASVNGIHFNGVGLATISGNEVHHLASPVTKGIYVQPNNGTSTVSLDSNRLTGLNSGNGIETLFAGTGSLALTATDNIVNNWQTGILVAASTGATLQQSFQNNSILGNTTGFVNQYSTPVDATCNWWGDASGPSGAGPGTGNPVGTNVNFTPWATISSYVSINAGVDQTIYLGYGAQSKTLTATVTACGTAQIFWSTGATSSSITVSPTTTTMYSVTLTDQSGHSTTDQVTVFVQDVRCEGNKILICHKESSTKRKNKCVPLGDVPSHLSHGDNLGGCPASLIAGKGLDQNETGPGKIAAVDEDLSMTVYHNPSASDFLIMIGHNNNKAPVMIQAFDVNGKLVEQINNYQGTAIKIGRLYRPGNYYIRITQGRVHREARLIKLEN